MWYNGITDKEKFVIDEVISGMRKFPYGKVSVTIFIQDFNAVRFEFANSESIKVPDISIDKNLNYGKL